MKSGLVLLAMCVALSGVCCNPPRSEMAGGKCVAHPVAGGKCVAHPKCDTHGNVVDVDTDPPCVKARVDDHNNSGAKSLLVNGEPLVENTGAITFGTGTSTCYGPPIPNPPICICTKSPCP